MAVKSFMTLATGRQWVSEKNTLAYRIAVLITAVKSFIAKILGRRYCSYCPIQGKSSESFLKTFLRHFHNSSARLEPSTWR
jgi:hypothetical protein